MELDYKDSDFDDLYVNIHEVKKGNSVLKKFPELDQFEEFKKDLDILNVHRDNIIRYIIYCYDPKTPLPKDLIERKQHAAILAGFKPKKGRFHVNITDIFRGLNKEVNAMIVKYCITISPQYSLYVSGWEAYQSTLLDLQAGTPLDADPVKTSAAKTDLFNKSEVMLGKLNSLRDKILARDKAKPLEAELFDIVAKKEKLNLRPENHILNA
jgi:hypothetical protein